MLKKASYQLPVISYQLPVIQEFNHHSFLVTVSIRDCFFVATFGYHLLGWSLVIGYWSLK